MNDLFSVRHGYGQARAAIQIESLDDETRNRLWSCLADLVFESVPWKEDPDQRTDMSEVPEQLDLATAIWDLYFKRPLDSLPTYWENFVGFVRNKFLRESKWYEVLDLLELISWTPPAWGGGEGLRERCNIVFEQEKSGYRFVGGLITPITSAVEIEAIEDAANTKLENAAAHIRRALTLFADRKNPDFCNSAKESICAVEAVCREVTGDDKATLGAALRQMETAGALHPALCQGLAKIYGFTNDAGGIRHARSDAPTVGAADAKFMLVVCSAFVNFATEKVLVAR